MTPTPTNFEIAYELVLCRNEEQKITGNFAYVGTPTPGQVLYVTGTDGVKDCYIVGQSAEGATFTVQTVTAYVDCETCAAGPIPTPSITPTRTPSATPAASITPTRTKTPTPTRTVTPSICTTQIVIDWSIQTCARGTFRIYVNGSQVYSKNAVAVAGSGVDTITVPYGSTINIQGTATYIGSVSCPLTQQSATAATVVGGGGDGATKVCFSDTLPNTFSYTYTKTCPTSTIYLEYVTEPL
jgi:hypothetical protein